MHRHWGLVTLGKKGYEESISGMEHTDRIIERILVLGGLPKLQALLKCLIGEDTPEMADGD